MMKIPYRRENLFSPAGLEHVALRGEEKLTYLMCDLASAANRNTDDPKFYTLFV